MDSEVNLFVDKTAIVCGIDNNAQWNDLTIGIAAALRFTTDSDTCSTIDSHAIALLTDCIAFATIIVSANFVKFEWCNIALIRFTKTCIDRRRDGRTYSVWGIANLEGRVHHVVCGIFVIDHDTRVMTSLIGQCLELLACVLFSRN